MPPSFSSPLCVDSPGAARSCQPGSPPRPEGQWGVVRLRALVAAVALIVGCSAIDLSNTAGGPIDEEDCGFLLSESPTGVSGHYTSADVCAGGDNVTPCGQGGGGEDVGLHVVPRYRSLVTVKGGVMAGDAYLALRQDCSTQPYLCRFDPWREGFSFESYPGEDLFFHAGAMDGRSCGSVRIDLSVWLLECGRRVLIPPSDNPYRPAVPSRIFVGDRADALYLVQGGRIGRFELADAAAAPFEPWFDSEGDVLRIDDVAVYEGAIFALSVVCTNLSADGADRPCAATQQMLETYDIATGELLDRREIRDGEVDQIVIWDGWVIGLGRGGFGVLAAEADQPVDWALGPAPGASIEPIVELVSVRDRVILAATGSNLYGVHGSADLEMSFHHLEGASDRIRGMAYQPAGAPDEPDLVAVIAGQTLTLYSASLIDEEPFVALRHLGEVALGSGGTPESVSFVEPDHVVVALGGPSGDEARGSLAVVDVSHPSDAAVRHWFEAYWSPGTAQVLADPAGPSRFFVNEEMGIGLVDLSDCP